MKAEPKRHSIIITGDAIGILSAGGTCIWSNLAIAPSSQPVVLDYDMLGDALYRIDTATGLGATFGAIIETYTEERPQETP